MIVYGASLSPFVRKVLAYGAEKGLELEHKPLGLGSDDPDFLAASPFRKIPASATAISPSPIRRPSSIISKPNIRSRR